MNSPIFSSGKTARLITFLATALMFAHAVALRYTPDDAYVSFRYARNIAQGHGAVFNIGEQVEGYTSPLWVFTLAALYRLGLSIEGMATIVSIASGVIAVSLLPRLSRRLGFTLYGLDALLLAANSSFAVWSGAAMEISTFALVLVPAILMFVREEKLWLVGSLYALLSLIRPEGLLFGGLAIVFAFVPVLRRQPRAWPHWIILAVTFTAPVLIHLLWRLSYYGYPLPNTFYDKVGFSAAQVIRGAKYLAEGAWQYSLPMSLPMIVGISLARDRKRLFAVPSLIGYLLYVAFVGGDWMVSFRLITPAMPLIALFAAAGWVRIWQGMREYIHTDRLAWLQWITVAIAALGLITLDFVPSLTVEIKQPYAEDGKLIAEWLNLHCPKEMRLAVFAAGSLPWHAAEFHIVDMFGLVDSTLAHLDVPTMGEGSVAGHEKFNAGIILKKHPNIFVFQAALGDERITAAEGWRAEPLAHLIRQFTDDIDFWSNHSTQSAAMASGKYFNFVARNPYPCR